MIRLLAFAYVGYFNNDNHFSVIEYVSRHGVPPNAAQFNQAYHPPLYYFLAVPFFLLGSLPAVQGLSLLLSIATLTIIAGLIRQLPWIDENAQAWCLALAAFHPQFVLFNLFISNDTLAIFLGALMFYQCWRVQVDPSPANRILLGVFLGLGLLTKAVFLVFILPLTVFLWLNGRRLALTRPRIFSNIAVVLCISAVLGCYKYAENFLLFGNPVLSNLDIASWTAEQKPTWIGARSLLDFNLLKLVRDPAISAATVHSYPLMIYGSFWYSLVPESTFHGNLIAPFNRVGSLIYLAALCPTVLIVIGASRMGMVAIRSCLGSTGERNQPDQNRTIYEGVSVFTLLLNLLLILSVGWHYDVWSVFQGRLLFPSYCAVLLALSRGMEWAQPSRLKTNIIRCLLVTLISLFLVFFMTEFWLASAYPINPLSMDHMPYKIDMHLH